MACKPSLHAPSPLRVACSAPSVRSFSACGAPRGESRAVFKRWLAFGARLRILGRVCGVGWRAAPGPRPRLGRSAAAGGAIRGPGELKPSIGAFCISGTAWPPELEAKTGGRCFCVLTAARPRSKPGLSPTRYGSRWSPPAALHLTCLEHNSNTRGRAARKATPLRLTGCLPGLVPRGGVCVAGPSPAREHITAESVDYRISHPRRRPRLL